VREILFRTLYRGEITWNKTRKRDQWGGRVWNSVCEALLILAVLAVG